jgi:Spy/CpxP family protein refolding chaperone
MSLMLAAVSASGQGGVPPPDQAKQLTDAGQTRQDMLAELGLTPEQFQQLRQMNADRKPLVEAAAKRLREANRSLDQVIYGDAVDESEFRTRLKEFQDAQTEVARIRFEGELTLRRVLTPDQLAKFREIRRQAAQERKALREQNKPLQNVRRMRQLNRGPLPRKLP